jgi:hypothetical protein
MASLLDTLALHAGSTGEERFADEIFCRARALFRDPSRPPAGHPRAEEVLWLRPEEVCSAAGAPPPELFVDSSASSDVVQGALGDCWFLSALGVVAMQPELISRVFSRWGGAADGGAGGGSEAACGGGIAAGLKWRQPCVQAATWPTPAYLSAWCAHALSGAHS